MRFATVQEPVPAPLAPYVTTGYKLENGGYVKQPFEIVGGFRPAGSAAVSALDMTHFMLAHLQGGRYGDHQILKPETTQLMHATSFAPEPRFPGMALGFYHQDIDGIDAVGHGGDTVYCHSDMLLLPKENVGLFLSFITEDNRVREKVEQAFFERYFPPPAARAARLPDGDARALANNYAGSYRWTRRNHSDIEKMFNLFSTLKVSPLDNGNLVLSGLGPDAVQLEPIGVDLYREVLYGNVKVSFRSDQSGRVTHMFFNFLPFMPTEQAPMYEQGTLWFTLMGAASLVFLGTLASTYYRWREIRVMPPAQRRAMWARCVVAGWAFATVGALGGVVAATGLDGLFMHIPTSLTVALVMPIIFVVLSLWLIAVTVNVWRGRLWSTARRIRYALTAVAAVVFCLFFWQWNLLGWHYG
jgi:hypothetical protein